jgi:hypothetical protein
VLHSKLIGNPFKSIVRQPPSGGSLTCLLSLVAIRLTDLEATYGIAVYIYRTRVPHDHVQCFLKLQIFDVQCTTCMLGDTRMCERKENILFRKLVKHTELRCMEQRSRQLAIAASAISE